MLGSAQNNDDEDDVEQQKLAKRFARRARMNRLLEIHGNAKEFSQNTQDLDLEKELKSIRVSEQIAHQRSHLLIRAHKIINSFFQTVHSSRVKRQSSIVLSSSGDSNLARSESSLLSSSSSLSFAINRSRNKSKRKLGFLGSVGNKKGRGMRSKAGGISLGHVVFQDSQNVPMSRSSSLPLPKASNKASFKKRSISDTNNGLWSKVASKNGFKKPRGLSAKY